MATPKANPESLSMAPAITSTTNQGWTRRDETGVEQVVWAWIIIPTDNNWAAAWHEKSIRNNNNNNNVQHPAENVDSIQDYLNNSQTVVWSYSGELIH